jgi:hypothetical protein
MIKRTSADVLLSASPLEGEAGAPKARLMGGFRVRPPLPPIRLAASRLATFPLKGGKGYEFVK